jgi:hypothetical protein
MHIYGFTGMKSHLVLNYENGFVLAVNYPGVSFYRCEFSSHVVCKIHGINLQYSSTAQYNVLPAMYDSSSFVFVKQAIHASCQNVAGLLQLLVYRIISSSTMHSEVDK